ncbi:MAG: DMT family transporter [Anaerolineales bacterium]|nr:DMT family transporter [Anaerolineales bacterium]
MSRLVGFLLIILSAAAFGTLAIFARWADDAGADGVTTLFFRFALSAVVMVSVLLLRREAWPRGADLVRLILMGGVGYFGQSLCYVTAIQYAPAGLVALLLYLYPIFVTILSVIFLKEKLTRAKIVALVLASLGTALTVAPEEGAVGGQQWIGIGLAVLAAAIYSIYILVGTQVMKRVSVVQSSSVIMSAAAMSFGAAMLVGGPQLPTAAFNGWVAIIAIVIISTLLPILLFLDGLNRIGPVNASMLSTLEPVVTVLLAVWLLNETLRPISLVGGAFILLAVLLLTRAEMERPTPVTSSP